MLLIEITSPKVSPLIKTTNFGIPNSPHRVNQVIKLLDHIGYTDGNVNYVIKNILTIPHTVQLLNHMMSYNIPISDAIVLTAIKRLTQLPSQLKLIINKLTISDEVWEQLTSLKVYDFPSLLAVYPNVPEQYIINAINTHPKYANKIQNILTNITPAIEQVLKKHNKRIVKKMEVDSDDLNNWTEAQLIAYFKKLPANQIKIKLSELKDIPESVAIIVVKKQPHLIKQIPSLKQTKLVQRAVIDNAAHYIFHFTNPDIDNVIYAFSKQPSLLIQGMSMLDHQQFMKQYMTGDVIKQILTNPVSYHIPIYKDSIKNFIKYYFKSNTLLMNKWLRYVEQQYS